MGKSMGRDIVAGVLGVLIAVGLVWIVDVTGHAVYPPPANLDYSDEAAMRAYVAALPLGALLFVGGAWFIGALGGTFAACKIGQAKPEVYAMVVGGFILVATVANLMMIPHPLWLSITGIAGIVFASWLGQKLGA